MWIFNKPIDQLGEEDLRALIANRVRETTTLEYKRAMHAFQPPAVTEMLRDVASIANAQGGVMIFGMDEDGQGVAKKLVKVADPEGQANRLVSSCLSGISERIPGLRAVPISYSRGAGIVVRIPRSHRRPHMVTYQGANEYWIRHDRQKSRMSAAEVRTAVTMTEDMQTRVKQFIEDRKNTWAQERRFLLVLGATPLLLEDGRIPITDARLGKLLSEPPTFRSGGRGVTLRTGAIPEPTIRGLRVRQEEVRLLEVFRNGHVEFALWGRERLASRPSDGTPWTIHGFMIPEFLRNFSELVQQLRSMFALVDPYSVTLNVYGARRITLAQGMGDRSSSESSSRIRGTKATISFCRRRRASPRTRQTLWLNESQTSSGMPSST